MALERITDFASTERLSLYAAMLRADEVPGLAARARTGALDFAGCIQEMRRLQESVSVGDLITRLIERSGYAGFLREDHTREGEERMRNVHELLNTARQFEETSEDASLSAFLETLSLASDLDTYQENGNAVTLMTLHTAKGLEFPVVFLVGLEEGLLPHQRGQESGSALEEERRLCYVGVTRARERLYLSYANARMVMGTTSRTRPSRFVKEMRDSLEQSETPAAPRAGSAWSLFPSGTEHVRRRGMERTVFGAAPTTVGDRGISQSAGELGLSSPGTVSATVFKVGEKVRHKLLGIGLIVQIDPAQNTIKIAFEGQGIKKFQADLAPIEKM